MKEAVVARVTEIAERVAGSAGIEIVDVALAGLEEGAVALETQPGTTLRFGLGQIQKANLKFEW